MYKEIWKPTVGDVLFSIHERNNQHDRYAIAATKLLRGRLSNVTLGHLPREISRFTRFLIQEAQMSSTIAIHTRRLAYSCRGDSKNGGIYEER